jgi:C4-dicarboxylate-specific signal transduction histidine kinase
LKVIVLMSKLTSRASFWIILGLAVLLVWGCQAKPLSTGAATFKQEIMHCLADLETALKEPVARKDKVAINAALEEVESPALKLCRMCPFQIGILDRYGQALATYPPRPGGTQGKNYSSYFLVSKALKSKKIQQQRFYLQNGTQLYIICAPLLKHDKIIGLVALAVNSADAAKRWGVTDKEFLALDFNN